VIASLRGVLRSVGEDTIVVEVGGVGFLIWVPATIRENLPRPGQPVQLYTHMTVRDNDISLYGFGTSEELELFKMLLTVSGIGPRTALATLSAFAPETLRTIIASGDAAALARTPGIGRKTAQRLLLELREKLGTGEPLHPTTTSAIDPEDADVLEALGALGYTQAEAQAAIGAVPDEVAGVDARILAALRILGGR